MTATWEDVATALGRLASSFTLEAQAQLTHWLTGASLQIRRRFGDLALLDQEALKYVMAEVVANKARRAASAGQESSVSVAVDDGTVTRRYENPTPVTAEDFTNDLWDLLIPGATPEAFTINPINRGRIPNGCRL